MNGKNNHHTHTGYVVFISQAELNPQPLLYFFLNSTKPTLFLQIFSKRD